MNAANPAPIVTAAPLWLDTPDNRPLRKFKITVLIYGATQEYVKEFRSSMDAYEDAFSRYEEATRIEVIEVPYCPATEPGKAALS